MLPLWATPIGKQLALGSVLVMMMMAYGRSGWGPFQILSTLYVGRPQKAASYPTDIPKRNQSCISATLMASDLMRS